MAANTIVFDPSTDDEEYHTPTTELVNGPVKQKTMRISEMLFNESSDSDSDQDSAAVVKTNRTTLRGHCNRNQSRLPLEDVSNDTVPLYNIYTKPVSTGIFSINTLNTEVDLDDVDEDEQVFTYSKKGTSKRRTAAVKQTKTPDTCVIDSENEVEDVTPISDGVPLTRDRSPTPPPSDDRSRRPVRRRRTRTPKGTTKAIGNLESLKGRLQMQKQYDDYYDSSDDGSIVDDSPATNKTITIKVRSIQGIQRILMKPMETFEGVIKEMAEKQGVPLEQVVLYFGDHNVQPYDTPHMLKFTIADILDCHTIRRRADDSDDDSDDECDEGDDDLEDPSMIRLRIRGNDKHSPTLTIRLKRTDPLEKLMREYAMKCGFGFEELKFSFDGDVVKRTDTAETLDMEDDDCIDITRYDCITIT